MFIKKDNPKVEYVIPPLKKQDLTLEELKKYNGKDDEHICFAILGKILDVSRAPNFYGPGGPYGNLCGRDATRALGTMDPRNVKDDYDDISDLTETEKETAKDWLDKLSMKYPTVGRLLTNGEKPTDYGEEISKIEF
ncbi:Cytochrome b5-like heme/steroid binding domain-containing protein [Strongyloides ratti]|uniref:Cytochrome b5-like heme/steroid binding domain-containing protein n=1 Tax=Strongyloides ratti TaxID=34506 RepID=A0A090MXF5_STRRB|nr:Cytochrome b5-like heme/steroid binding domain-containing protein [Strongyloides ratti]CEF65344.1 Cytochrome b5-like heme/steroid binding domain-containing protein [Strongyloides ratti]